MAKNESGCLTYQKRWLRINFTGDTVDCDHCPVLETYARKQCRATGEYLRSNSLTGIWCPLVEYPGTIGHVPDEFINS